MIIQVINVTYRKLHHHQERGNKNARMKVTVRPAAAMKPGKAAVIIGENGVNRCDKEY